MNKNIYHAAFEMLLTQNDMCNHIENSGLRFEYGVGFWGTTLENLVNQCYTIIKEALNVQYLEQSRNVFINGSRLIAQFDVLFVGDFDEKFTITEDDFSDFIFQAVNDEVLQDLFWDAMVNKNEASREKFNKRAKNCRISNYWKG